MSVDGYIQGSTNASAGQRPGEKVIHTYTGSLSHGQILTTYLSQLDSYFVDDLTTLDGTNRTYFTNVYKVVQPYGRAYLSVYMGYSGGSTGGSPVGAASSAKVNALIIGER